MKDVAKKTIAYVIIEDNLARKRKQRQKHKKVYTQTKINK